MMRARWGWGAAGAQRCEELIDLGAVAVVVVLERFAERILNLLRIDVAEHALAERLVEADGERGRVAARERNAEELAQVRDLRLAVTAADAFGHVEDDVDVGREERAREVDRRLERHHGVAVALDGLGDRLDGLRRIVLRLAIVAVGGADALHVEREADAERGAARLGARLGRVEELRLLRGLAGLVGVLDLIAVDARHLGPQRRALVGALGGLDLALEELDGPPRVAARRVELAQPRRGRRGVGVDVEGLLVALDGGVAVALLLQHLRELEQHLHLLGGRLRPLGELLVGLRGGAHVALEPRDAPHGVEGRGVRLVHLQGAFEAPLRAVEGADGVEQHAARGHEELGLLRRVVDDGGVALEQRGEVVPAPEHPQRAPEAPEALVVGGVDAGHLLVGLRRALVVDKLLLQQRAHAVAELRLLPRRRRQRNLRLQRLQQPLVVARARVEPLQALQ